MKEFVFLFFIPIVCGIVSALAGIVCPEPMFWAINVPVVIISAAVYSFT